MIPEQLWQFLVAYPEAVVIAVYALVVLLKYTRRDISIYAHFSVAEMLAIAVSLFYQYMVISPETGVQAVMLSVTSIIGISIFLRLLATKYLVS